MPEPVNDQIQRDIIDELGALEAELAPLKPKHARLEVLRKQVRYWAQAQNPSNAYTFQGDRFLVMVGPAANERTVARWPLLKKLLGVKLFMASIKIPIKVIEANLSPADVARVLSEARTGPRSVTSVARTRFTAQA